ncbi:ultrapetala 1-like protein, partial [Tanacetum coccineum]
MSAILDPVKIVNNESKAKLTGDSYERPCYKTSLGDEFLQFEAKACDKLRWFKLKSKEECWFYHDLAANKNRTCSDMGWPSLYDKAQPLYLEKITTLKKSYGREDS